MEQFITNIITIEDLQDQMAPKKLGTGVVQSIVSGAIAWVEREIKRCWGETCEVVERHAWKSTV